MVLYVYKLPKTAQNYTHLTKITQIAQDVQKLPNITTKGTNKTKMSEICPNRPKTNPIGPNGKKMAQYCPIWSKKATTTKNTNYKENKKIAKTVQTTKTANNEPNWSKITSKEAAQHNQYDQK